MKTSINGFCDDRFSLVREEFEKNFEKRGEVGASFCLKLNGETVVDLWGGIANQETNAPWEKDTVCVVWSCTKGATALCAHILASRGQLDYNKPVAYYWPEFAANGKENITVAMLMAHQAGLPGVRKPLPPKAFFDWNTMTSALASEVPFWDPGTKHGYHTLTYGWLVGELVRRVSGKSLGTFFQEEVATPLGIDFWIGLPEEIESRVAPIIPEPPAPSPYPAENPNLIGLRDSNSAIYSVLMNSCGLWEPGAINKREVHAAEIGAANGVTNARGLAGMYAPLSMGGSINGKEYVNAEVLQKMSSVYSASGEDATLFTPTRFSLGYMKSMDNRWYPALHKWIYEGKPINCIFSEAAFGHVGKGGSIGLADPEAHFSLGYAMNRLDFPILLGERGQSLVDAVYRSLGYTSNACGVWIK